LEEKITFTPIGIVHSPYKEPKGVPIQPAGAKGSRGVIEIYPEYAPGLKDLEGFSHIYVLFHFHKGRLPPESLKLVPYLDDKERGLFATRAPSRPNPIGLSLLKLVEVRGRELHVEDLDMIDDTPVLDIKPFAARFDNRENSKAGWLEGVIHKLDETRDDGRFKD